MVNLVVSKWCLQLPFLQGLEPFLHSFFQDCCQNEERVSQGNHFDYEDSVNFTQDLEDNSLCQHLLVIGLGSGKWLEKTKKWLLAHSARMLIIYEPNFLNLYAFLQDPLAEFWIDHPQVAIIPSSSFQKISPLPIALKDQAKESSFSYFTFNPQAAEFDYIAKLLCQGSFKVFYHASYASHQAARLLGQQLMYMIDDYRTICRESLLAPDKMSHSLKNARHLLQSAFHLNIRLDPAIPIILCGAGPSLTDQMDWLKLYRDRALLVSCGTATGILEAHGIEPDWIAGVCPYSTHYERFKKNSSTQAPILSCLHVHPGVMDLAGSMKVVIANLGATPAAKFLESYFLPPLAENSDYGSSVLTSALKACYEMGARRFILVGVDLCYKNKMKYGKGADCIEAVEALKFSDATETPYDFNNVQGNKVTSHYLWAYEKEWLEKFIAHNTNIQLYQTTTEGLPIQGAAHTSLSQALSLTTLVQHDLQSQLWQQFAIAPKALHVDSAAIYEDLADSFERVSDLCHMTLEQLATLFKDFNESSYESLMQTYEKNLQLEPTYRGFLNHIDWSLKSLQEAKIWRLLKSTKHNTLIMRELATLDAHRVLGMQKRVNQLLEAIYPC